MSRKRFAGGLLLDFRHAVRVLAKSRGSTLVIVASLAIGIGANTAIFTVANEVLFDRLSVPHPEQLRLLTWTAPKSSIVRHMSNDAGPGGERTAFPYPVYQQLRGATNEVGNLFAFKNVGRLAATIDGEAVAVQTQMVSGNYYAELSVRPALGRPIEPLDDTPSGGGVATISHTFWVTSFAQSPAIVGKKILLNGQPVTIIGVNALGFTGASDAHLSPDVFVPLAMQPLLWPQRKGSLLNDSDYWWLQVMARAGGQSPALAADASLNTRLQSVLLAMTAGQNHPILPRLISVDGSRGLNASARGLTDQMRLLLALVATVLLLACANIANLLLARSLARHHEISVRMALGAGRGQILRQMLTESLLLSSLGGVAGLVIAYVARGALPRLMSPSWVPPIWAGHFDPTVLAFAGSVSILAGLIFGLVPAWYAIRLDAKSALKEPTLNRSRSRQGLPNKVIASFQIALSTFVVVGAVLFIRTLINLNGVDLGFRPDHLLLFRVQLPPSLYPPPRDVLLSRSIEEKLSAIPGVESATLSARALVANARDLDDFVLLDVPEGDAGSHGEAATSAVGATFFQTLGISMLAGRSFAATDTPTSPKVAVINQSLAKKYFSGANPLGKRFRGYQFVSAEPFEIVGVCADVVSENLRRAPTAGYYVLSSQLPQTDGELTYEVRTSVEPYSVVSAIREAVRSVDRDIPVLGIRTQADQINDSIRQERLLTKLTVGFGLLGLLLACIGIYGAMEYTVVRRTNEIGVRLALGAEPRDILKMIMSEAFRVTLVGVLIGLGLAAMLTRFMATLLFDLSPWDPIALASATCLLVAVSLLAALGPALQAARVEALEALRYE